MNEEKIKLTDTQYNFLWKLKNELVPLDENVDRVLVKVMKDREYTKFQKMIINDLRARWIREQGLHAETKWENEINRIDRNE